MADFVNSTTYFWGQESNKTFVEYRLIRQGPDLLIIISGGAAHIGSIAYSDKLNTQKFHQFTYRGHRENAIVTQTINALAEFIEGEVLVLAGIHYDEITKEQIEEINANCSLIIERIKRDLIGL